MHTDSMSEERSGRWWPGRRTVWRWHFYAGLFCAPFVLILATSGSLYLFRTEIEAWIDGGIDRSVQPGEPATASRQIEAALAAVPGSTFVSYQVRPEGDGGAVRVFVATAGRKHRVCVDPVSLSILDTVPEEERLMRRLFRLHGELWMGEYGSWLVELAASWTILMILTGLILWWPRNASGLGGVVYPRFSVGRRTWLRDLHAVTGVWISVFAMLLLMSGLPWSRSWGSYLRLVRSLTGTTAGTQDWSTGRRAEEGHEGHAVPRAPAGTIDLQAVDRIVATVAPLRLDPPVLITPPRSGASDAWTVKSETANRPRRVDLRVAPTGEVVARRGFMERHWIDRVVGYGIALHEGRLFGWPNQLFGLLTATGLVLIVWSGITMWWRRRPQGELGAPTVVSGERMGVAPILAIVLLAVTLPFFGASLLLVILLERTLLAGFPSVRVWLGLPTRGAPLAR